MNPTKLSKSLLAGAAVSGLIAGSFSAKAAQIRPDSLIAKAGQADLLSVVLRAHACKGQNACKGQGGCKSGDQGCKGKNTCKGKGGCATKGSVMPPAKLRAPQ
jgi:hypothetical protein